LDDRISENTSEEIPDGIPNKSDGTHEEISNSIPNVSDCTHEEISNNIPDMLPLYYIVTKQPFHYILLSPSNLPIIFYCTFL